MIICPTQKAEGGSAMGEADLQSGPQECRLAPTTCFTTQLKGIKNDLISLLNEN